MTRFLILSCLVLAACGADVEPEPADTDEGPDVCQQAADLIESCTGTAAVVPAEGCVGDFQATSQTIVDGGCEGIDTEGGKSDVGGFWCLAINRWAGLCKDELSLEEAAVIADTDDICPAQGDDLCDALRAEDWAEVLRLAGPRLRADPSDGPAQLALRERVVSLLIYNQISAFGRFDSEPDRYDRQADGALAELFPAYDPKRFAMARTWQPPETTDCQAPKAALLVYPGVVRLLDRQEFKEQIDGVDAHLPCVQVERVETGSFVDPSVNADQAEAVADALPVDMPIHMLGYSQGARNALETLTRPSMAARTRTLITLNGAIHGSEVADVLHLVIQSLHLDGPVCTDWPGILRPICQWGARLSPRPTEFLVETIAFAMGITPENLDAFLDAEDELAPAPDLASFLQGHNPGVASLTTEGSAAFWADGAHALPTSTLYVSFASVISDPDRNLPGSNALFWHLLRRAGGSNPFNDMQVRLPNQRLGGPVGAVEVQMPVAEGNHWQWELSTKDVPPTVMPPEMVERIPHVELMVAWLQTLEEFGLLAE